VVGKSRRELAIPGRRQSRELAELALEVRLVAGQLIRTSPEEENGRAWQELGRAVDTTLA